MSCIVRIIGTCKSGCLVNMWSCKNFTVFSFVIVFNNKKKFVPYQSIMLLLLSNNINIQSPWMLSLEILGSVCAAAADYRQIRYSPWIPAGASKDFINEYNNTSQFFTSSRKILCLEKSFHLFHLLYIFKMNGTEVIDESAVVCLHFSGHVTSQAFERVLSFCWNSRCMYFI